jgi:hypothetical protein
MKKFMFLFLIVAFVAVMVGGAIACGENDQNCWCGSNMDDLSVKLKMIPCNMIDFGDSTVELCAYIPCGADWNTTECIDEEEFGFKFCASGTDPAREMTVTSDLDVTGIELWLKMGENSFEELNLAGDTTFNSVYIANIPNDDENTGSLKLKVKEEAEAGEKDLILTFTITGSYDDLSCNG